MTAFDEHIAVFEDGKEEGRAEGLARAAEICQEMADAWDAGGPGDAVAALTKAAERIKAEAGD